MNYYLRGPIYYGKEGTTVITVGTADTVSYFLNYDIDLSNFILDPRYGNAIPLTLQKDSNGVYGYFETDDKKLYLSYDENNVIIASTKKTYFNLCNDTVASFEPNVPLAGISYTLRNTSGDAMKWKSYIAAQPIPTDELPTDIAKDENDVPLYQYIEMVRFISIWYIKGSCKPVADFTSVYNGEVDWILNKLDDTGFTNARDCADGIDYNYCPAGQYCSNQNCKGPCQDTSKICSLSLDRKTYKCETKIYNDIIDDIEQYWYIYLLSLFIIIALIFIFYLLLRKR